jgi:hypothetical protein
MGAAIWKLKLGKKRNKGRTEKGKGRKEIRRGKRRVQNPTLKKTPKPSHSGPLLGMQRKRMEHQKGPARVKR